MTSWKWLIKRISLDGLTPSVTPRHADFRDGEIVVISRQVLGVCWGMAVDASVLCRVFDSPARRRYPSLLERSEMVRIRDDGYSTGVRWWVLWLLDHARPPGCRAPWGEP